MKKFILLSIIIFAFFANNSVKAFNDLDGDGYWDIANYNDLLTLQSDTTLWANRFELTADIIIPSGVNSYPIGKGNFPFNGWFRGKDPSNNIQYKIIGLNINRPNLDAVGLFGVNLGYISDLVLCNFNIVGRNQVGALCGLNGGAGGDISGCEIYFDVANNNYSTTTVIGNSCVGGLVGANWREISNCKPTKPRLPQYTYVSVTGNFKVGGLIGDNRYYPFAYGDNLVYNSEVYNAEVIGSGEGVEIGGLAGYNNGTINKCYVNNLSTVDAGSSNYIGGFVGKNITSISLSCSRANVVGDNAVGGFMGLDSGFVHDCYSRGSVSGSDSIGGFVGVIRSVGSVNKCFSACNGISPALTAGGFVQYNYGTATYCVWDSQSSGITWSAAGIGYSTAASKTMTPYTTWDWTNTWELNSENNGYPSFRLVPLYKVNLDNVETNIEIYPNPVNDVSTINIKNILKGLTTLSIYNVNGEKMETLFSGDLSGNEFTMNFNGNNLASGMYYMIVESNNNKIMKPILVKH